MTTNSSMSGPLRVLLASIPGMAPALALLVLLINAPVLASQELSAVLITTSTNSLPQISKTDVRRMYLGLPSINDTGRSKPVLNLADEVLYREFLKNVMHMTEDGYKRKLIKRVFRYGAATLASVESLEGLDNHLAENPEDICFVRITDVDKIRNARVLMTLW
ncbi:MAG: hypothetical protein OEZ10_07650 [Gammaproteobacteria bacterium]|nr:hypothetical protein [Gammaproteobacteria bacterium]